MKSEHEEDKKESYSFIQETIKDETTDKRKRSDKYIRNAVSGLIFGLAACLGFFVMQPIVERVQNSFTKSVTVPEETDGEGKEAAKEESAVSLPQLNMDTYTALNDTWNDVIKQSSKSVVEVTGILNDSVVTAGNLKSENSTAGMIVADNGSDVFILTDCSIASNAKGIEVTFANYKTYAGSILHRDTTLGIAIMSVKKKELSESTKKAIQVAEIGSISGVSKGDLVAVVGQPFGYADGQANGVVSSTQQYLNLTDGKYRMIGTDIACSNDATGVLINTKGQILGFVNQRMQDTEKKDMAYAVSFSAISREVESLSNDVAVPFLGIQGVEINGEVAQERGLEKGIYVTNVIMDSPAMTAGIQNGDIIVKMRGNTIVTFSAFRKELLEAGRGSTMSIQALRSGKSGYDKITFTAKIGSRE